MNRVIDDRFEAVVWGGFLGGAAEVVVVTLAALFAGIGGWAVATGVSDAVYPAAFQGEAAIWVGMTIHFVLSFLIAACFVPFAARIHCLDKPAVWAMNFFVILPRVAPEFVTIVPYPVSFLSKLSFGVVMGLTLVYGKRRAEA